MRQHNRFSTTQGILAAPKGATYVWVTQDVYYPKKLAAFLCRTDLVFVGPNELEYRRLAGRETLDVVLDHAVIMTEDQRYGYNRWRLDSKCRKNGA